ncbi:MAG: TlpA disulfide reductase family protein, partial [Ectothiorhodospiraceae bacterium]
MTGGGRLRMVAVAVLAAVLGAAAGIGGYRWYLNRGAEIRPLFALPDMNGERHSIAEWDGRVIVLNFWATWCAPCREEMPLLVDLQDKYGDQGLQIVGVALDRPDAVKAFADKMGLNYP